MQRLQLNHSVERPLEEAIPGRARRLALRSTDASEVLGGVERRRRRWSSDEKMPIVEETLVSGAKVSEVARRNGISASLVFTWRRQARAGVHEAARARALSVAIDDGRRCHDQRGPALLSFVRDRLADAPRNLAATSGRMKRDEVTHAADRIAGGGGNGSL
jgi:transposase-like protein